MRRVQSAGVLAMSPFTSAPLRVVTSASVAIASLGFGFAAGSGQSPQLFELAGVLVLAGLCLAFPWLSALLLTVSVASFAYGGALPEVHGIKISEIFLLLGLAAAAVRTSSLRLPRTRAERQISVLLSVFLMTEVVGVFVGRHHGASVADVAHGLRPTLYVASFWIFAQLARNREGRRVMFMAASGIAVVVVALQLLQIQNGALGRSLFLTSPGDNTITVADGFTRVRPPGLTLVYATAIFALAYLLWGPSRRRFLVGAVAAVCLLGILVSLNRNMLLGLVLGISAATLIAPRRRRAFTMAAVLGCATAITLALMPPAASSRGPTHTVVERMLSLGDFSGLKRTTLQDRYYENNLALRVLSSHPITGIGWGASYGARVSHYDDGLLVSEDRGYIHEQYLFLWLRTGIVGLVAFVGVLLAGFIAACRTSRAVNRSDQWIGAACLATLIALATGALVAMYFSDADSIVPLVGVLAIAATDRVSCLGDATPRVVAS